MKQVFICDMTPVEVIFCCPFFIVFCPSVLMSDLGSLSSIFGFHCLMLKADDDIPEAEAGS